MVARPRVHCKTPKEATILLQSHARGFLAREFFDAARCCGIDVACKIRKQNKLVHQLKWEMIQKVCTASHVLGMAETLNANSSLGPSAKLYIWKVVFQAFSEVLVWMKLYNPAAKLEAFTMARERCATIMEDLNEQEVTM